MSDLLKIVVDDKHYGARQVLRQLQLSIGQGEVVSLIGASGCGKSSLLSIVAGLDRNFRGAVRLDGRLLNGVSADIGFIFQEPRLFPWLTVADNVAFGATGGAKPNAGQAPQVKQLLAEVGLEAYGALLPKQLSGGQAQRVAIARGLFTRPRVLLLDEPFSAVDAFTRMKLQDLLSAVARQHQLTIVLVTHDIDEALHLSDRIVLLDTTAGPPRAEFKVNLAQPRQRAERGNPESNTLVRLKAAILDSLHAAHAI